jgi:hypothetical protein
MKILRAYIINHMITVNAFLDLPMYTESGELKSDPMATQRKRILQPAIDRAETFATAHGIECRYNIHHTADWLTVPFAVPELTPAFVKEVRQLLAIMTSY